MEKRGILNDRFDFYCLFWIFFISSFLGVVWEVLLVYVDTGVWMSRAGLVYGPFNLVYGLGAVLLTLILCRVKYWSNTAIFFSGILLGGGFEYFCSWFQETVFGTISWDYSDMLFQINGRVNLVYSLFWGLLGLIWVRIIYPFLSSLLERNRPYALSRTLTAALAVFMLFNICISGFAVYRDTERRAGVMPSNQFEVYLDTHFPAERLQEIYACAVQVDPTPPREV